MGCTISMKLINGIKETSLLPERVVATIGNFDGVHRGHQALIEVLHKQAIRLQCPLLVIIFEPQPGEYFHSQHAPVRLTSLREKLMALKKFSVDFVCCLKFNAELAHMPAEQFAEQVIFNSLNVKYLLSGADFRFGRDRLGDADLLAKIGKRYDAITETFPDFMIESGRISSTGIRLALQNGNFDQAELCLGRSYSICGRVIRGDGRGRKWGIPTANIALKRRILPLNGVYSVMINRPRNNSVYYGVANIGCRPTIEGQQKINLEVHLLDFDESLYNERLEVKFINKLRDEKKFSSVNELIAQIHHDIAKARNIFSATIHAD